MCTNFENIYRANCHLYLFAWCILICNLINNQQSYFICKIREQHVLIVKQNVKDYAHYKRYVANWERKQFCRTFYWSLFCFFIFFVMDPDVYFCTITNCFNTSKQTFSSSFLIFTRDREKGLWTSSSQMHSNYSLVGFHQKMSESKKRTIKV